MDDSQATTKSQRRRIAFAAGACAVAGGALYLSQQRTRRAWPQGTPLVVELGGLTADRLLTVDWQGRPVWVLRRDAAMLAALVAANPLLADPDSRASLQPPYARNALRSLRPDIFVAVGLCTHQGCTPALAGEHFLCPCHSSKYDLAGRVFRSGPAPANLTIPAYRFAGNDRLVIGEEASSGAA